MLEDSVARTEEPESRKESSVSILLFENRGGICALFKVLRSQVKVPYTIRRYLSLSPPHSLSPSNETNSLTAYFHRVGNRNNATSQQTKLLKLVHFGYPATLNSQYKNGCSHGNLGVISHQR